MSERPPRLYASLVTAVHGFFPAHLAPQIRELYFAAAILNFAVSMVLLFEPIYLYTIGFKVYEIMLFYFAIYFVYFFLIPLGGNYVRRHGFEHGILLGTVFLSLYYLCLFGAASQPLWIVGAVVALALQKTFYWPGYHSDFAFFGGSGQRGREIGNMVIIEATIGIMGPLAGGTIAALFGFPVLFLIAIVCILASNIPLLMTKEVFTPSHLPYVEMYRALVDPANRKYFVGFLGFSEELIALTLWPIFIFVTLGGRSVADVGWLFAATACATSLIFLILGRLADSHDRYQMMRSGTFLLSLAWFGRLLAVGGSSIFFVDTFSRISKSILSFPLVAGMYEHAVKSHIVRTVLFFEMSLSVGKGLTALFLAGVFYFFDVQWGVAFVMGGVMTLFYLILTRPHRATFAQS